MGRRQTRKRKSPTLSKLYEQAREASARESDALDALIREELEGEGEGVKAQIRGTQSAQRYRQAKGKTERIQKQIREKELSRRRVTREFIELANFEFDPGDLSGSWTAFMFLLQYDCRILPDGRPNLVEIDTKRLPDDLLDTQAVIRRALAGIVDEGSPPLLTFLRMAEHAGHVRHHVTNALSGEFRRYTVADTAPEWCSLSRSLKSPVQPTYSFLSFFIFR